MSAAMSSEDRADVARSRGGSSMVVRHLKNGGPWQSGGPAKIGAPIKRL